MEETQNSRKPTGTKSYGSIPHISGSRLGPGDHHCHIGQERLVTLKTRDKHDLVIIQEKLDGSNVGILRIGAEIYPLTRAGYVANTSKYLMHQYFYDWALKSRLFWLHFLNDGERICGEWMMQAHGTIYTKLESPIYFFDIIRGEKRIGWDEFQTRTADIYTVPLVFDAPLTPDAATRLLPHGGHFGATTGFEGFVYRLYRKGNFEFICKYVRPEKVDGCYLDSTHEIWNYPPEKLYL